IFSPIDPKTLYYAGNVLFKTTTGGHSWDIISPDLSREKPDIPINIGVYRTPELENMARRGVIYTVAPSFQDINTIWAGTDDGLIHITRNGGKTWQNITPTDLTSWSKVSLIEASHFDNETAYAAINRFRLDDLRPHIYRTHDGGKTWQKITKGIPENEVVNAVREDPIRKGLLFAGTERTVYVSFNDGDDWQSLRLNMPSTSIRDLVVHNDDIVVGTHGRSFWILDDITHLRQLNEKVSASEAFLFKPQLAYRVRRSLNTDTPIPPEEPMGQNPPDGAIINYFLQKDSQSPVVLEIYDQSNQLVRRFSSNDEPEKFKEEENAIPAYWVRVPKVLSAKVGMQRFVWNLHYPHPEGVRRTYPISAIYQDTPSEPLGPTVLPGNYTIKLIANGNTYSQELTIKLDPRVKTPETGIKQIFDIAMENHQGLNKVHQALSEIRELQTKLSTSPTDNKELLEKITELVSGNPDKNLTKLQAELARLLDLVEEVDATPTTQVAIASEQTQVTLKELLAIWGKLKTEVLKKAK
ncbi:MAG: glycoside hydrolase family protein, partial [bacterium]